MVCKEKEVWGEDIWEPELFSIEEEIEEEIIDNVRGVDSEISYRQQLWWEKQHWNDILDERKRWGDLNKENQNKLIKLIGRR